MSRSGLWAVGMLGKAHGLRGDLYLNLTVDGLDRLRRATRFYLARAAESGGGGLRPCELTRVGGDDRRPLVRLDLAQSREEAIALQGSEIFAAGGELDAQPFYRVGDLLGLRVETASGRGLGEVCDVLESPAHEILVVRSADGRSLLVPLVGELVSIDEEARIVRVVDGLFDDDEGVVS